MYWISVNGLCLSVKSQHVLETMGHTCIWNWPRNMLISSILFFNYVSKIKYNILSFEHKQTTENLILSIYPTMKFNINLNTLPKLNRLPLKNDGWKTILSYWVPVTFGVVKFREGINCTSWWFQPIWNILVKMGSSSPNRDENNKYWIFETTNQSCAWEFVSHISQPSILEYHHFRKPLYLSNHIFYFPLPPPPSESNSPPKTVTASRSLIFSENGGRRHLGIPIPKGSGLAYLPTYMNGWFLW